MKEFMKNYSLGAVACAVMGIALIVNPHIITDVFNTVIGVILIIWATFGIIGFIASCAEGKKRDSIFSLLCDIVLLAAGIYVFINTSVLETVVMVALGLYLFCSGVPRIISAFRIKRLDGDVWLMPFLTALLTTVLGAVIVIAPTMVSGTFMRVVGVLLAIAGIVSFISGASCARFFKKLEEQVEDEKYRRGKVKDDSDDDKSKAIDI